MRAPLRSALSVVLAVTALSVVAGAGATWAGFSGSTGSAGSVSTATLSPPTGLAASGTGPVALTWSATPSSYATGTRVLRAAAPGGPYTEIASVSPRSTTTYQDSPTSGTWYYALRAYYQGWTSTVSNEVTVTVPVRMRLATGSYTGNGADDRAITGAGFRPDLVIVKCACTQAAAIRTSTMTGDASKLVGSTGSLEADQVQSLDADGFTVGTLSAVNQAAQTYYWTAMRAGADLKLGTYVGDGLDNRQVTGVGFQPAWVITLGDGDRSLVRPASLAGDNAYTINGTGKNANRIQALTSDGFEVGSAVQANELGTTFHYVAWKAGVNVAQGSYTGDGLDDRSISGTGFSPALVWVKQDDALQAVWRPSSTAGDLALGFNGSAALANLVQAVEANGFQVGSHDRVNQLTKTFHYLALRDGGP